MRYLFIDVGSHHGQTLAEVLSPLWRFDRIYGFEPDPDCMDLLKQRYREPLREGRLVLTRAGLFDSNGQAPLFGNNEGGGATLYKQKHKIDPTLSLTVPIIRASDWVREHVHADCFAVMKLNCEGAECAIIHDLVATGEIARIGSLLVDFDIRKVRGKRGEARRALRALRSAGFDRYLLVENVMVGATHAERTRNWLSYIPECQRFCRQPEIIAAYRLRPHWRRRVRFMLRRLAA